MSTLAVRFALIAVAGLSLGACASYGPGGYGYSRVGVSIGSGYYSDPYYGWYDGFYYPGSGYYVWDRYGYRHPWTARHQRYWMARRADRHWGHNWSGYRYRRLGDYHRAPQRYRDRNGRPGGYYRYRSDRDERAEGARHYRDERAERQRRYREDRAERPSRGRGQDARNQPRRKDDDHPGRRRMSDD